MAYVLEFKVHDPEDEDTLEDTVQEALKQIRDKEYDRELTAQGIPKDRAKRRIMRIQSVGWRIEGDANIRFFSTAFRNG